MIRDQEQVGVSTENLPFVSVIVPCRNERSYIRGCLDSVLSTSYPLDKLEILVVDGRSDDGTKDILDEYERSTQGKISVLDNEKKILASAWNIGIRNSKGNVVMALNAHGVFKNDYISTCVGHLMKTDADYVGGVIKTYPRRDTFIGRGIALALSSRFGVGWSHFRVGVSSPIWTDTAAFGGYRRQIFDKVGLFNEVLTRSQDMDFHIRLRKAGGKILLAPDMVCDYFIRSDFKTFVKDYLGNGYWATYPLRYNPSSIYWRHLVPLAFVLGLIGSTLLAAFIPSLLWVLMCVLALYSATNAVFSLKTVVERGAWRSLPILPVLFSTVHIVYGAGSAVGLARAVAAIIRAKFWSGRV